MLEDLYRTDPIKACRLALHRTRGLPTRKRLEACDKLLNSHGVEACRYKDGSTLYYCNMGDPYSVTILAKVEKGIFGGFVWNRPWVGCWGTPAENGSLV